MRMFSITNNLFILKVRVTCLMKMYKGISKLLGNITCTCIYQDKALILSDYFYYCSVS